MLTDEQGSRFAGIGVIRLLESIEKEKSINAAARACGISYVKAWHMMNRLDKNLGQPVLDRTSGGAHGGGATLTPFGRRFLRQFSAYHRRMERTAGMELKRFAQKIALLLCVALSLTACSRKPEESNQIRVAAAADLQFAMKEIVDGFQASNPEWTVETTYGSSGHFYAQLINRAPFDVFFSADLKYPEQLIEQGIVEPGELFRYAIGRLAIWTPNDSPIDVQEMGVRSFFHPSVAKVSIANPRHAPYGVAAVAALQAYGVYHPIQAKLVLGENVAQAAQFIESGAAQIGVIALSLAVAPAMTDRGVYWEIPMDRYPAIDQGGVILPWTKNREAAEAFRDYVLSEAGRAILLQYGFHLPGD